MTAIPPMGIGQLGPNGLHWLPRRKFRWSIEIEFPNGKSDLYFCNVASRPDSNSKNLTTTIYETNNFDLKSLFEVLSRCYDPTKAEETVPTESQLGTIKLQLWDGCGVLIEDWILTKVWPISINYQELDHSNTSPIDIEITWKYQESKYTSHRPAFP